MILTCLDIYIGMTFSYNNLLLFMPILSKTLENGLFSLVSPKPPRIMILEIFLMASPYEIQNLTGPLRMRTNCIS